MYEAKYVSVVAHFCAQKSPSGVHSLGLFKDKTPDVSPETLQTSCMMCRIINEGIILCFFSESNLISFAQVQMRLTNETLISSFLR